MPMVSSLTPAKFSFEADSFDAEYARMVQMNDTTDPSSVTPLTPPHLPFSDDFDDAQDDTIASAAERSVAFFGRDGTLLPIVSVTLLKTLFGIHGCNSTTESICTVSSFSLSFHLSITAPCDHTHTVVIRAIADPVSVSAFKHEVARPFFFFDMGANSRRDQRKEFDQWLGGILQFVFGE